MRVPMLHAMLMAGATAALFVLNRFIEVTPADPLGAQAVYGQIGGILVCVVGSCAGAFILNRQHGTVRPHLRFAAALWALPLLWSQWSMDAYSTPPGSLAVRHGIGGSLGLGLAVAAAIALVFLDAVLRSSTRRAVPA